MVYFKKETEGTETWYRVVTVTVWEDVKSWAVTGARKIMVETKVMATLKTSVGT